MIYLTDVQCKKPRSTAWKSKLFGSAHFEEARFLHQVACAVAHEHNPYSRLTHLGFRSILVRKKKCS